MIKTFILIFSAFVISLGVLSPVNSLAQLRKPSNPPAQNPKPRITCKDVAEDLLKFHRQSREIFREIPKIYSSSALVLEGFSTALQDPSTPTRQLVLGKMTNLATAHRSNATSLSKDLEELIYIGDQLVIMSYNCMTKGTP
jgi:hypothetical protein